MNLEAFILGTGGMMPLPHRNLTSMLLRREGDLFLFDCGEATQISLRKLNLKWKKISAIFISHTHADHITGLPGIMMLSAQVDRDEPLYIYGPPKIKEYVEFSKMFMYVNYEIIVREITQQGIIWEYDEYYVKTFPLKHTTPCVGYSLIEKERPGIFHPEKAVELQVPKGPQWSFLQQGETVVNAEGEEIHPEQVLGPPRPGRKISFITDTSYQESVIPEIENSDLLICEGMFKNELEVSAKDKMHLTAYQAGKIAKLGNVRSMGLIHYSPRYLDRDLRELLKEAREIYPGTFLTYDRQKIEIPNRDVTDSGQ